MINLSEGHTFKENQIYSPRIHQLSRAPQLEVGAREPFPSHVGVLIGFILYRSCAVDQTFSEFMSASFART